MKIKIYFVWILTGMVGLSCSRKGNVQEAEAFLEDLEGSGQDTTIISDAIIGDIIQQIPSPMEMSMLIKASGLEYDKSILSPAEKYTNYSTTFSQAVNMGVYGTDLIYTNVFEKNQDGFGYIKSIKMLANELNIGQFFNIELISNLAMNSDNMDSILLITVRNFNDINQQLQDQRRANLSVLLLVGGWLEGLYINCKMAELYPDNEMLQEKIGEQKIFMENIMLLLDFYAGTDPNIGDFKDRLSELKSNFDRVKIIYTYEEPTYEVVNGVLSIIDNSSSTIEITQQDIQEISVSVEKIREGIIL